jgi:hypothetical protein
MQELMGKTLIVNTPMFFKFAWSVVHVALDERVRKKLIFLGKRDLHRLKEYIAPEYIPAHLGGKQMERLLSGKDGESDKGQLVQVSLVRLRENHANAHVVKYIATIFPTSTSTVDSACMCTESSCSRKVKEDPLTGVFPSLLTLTEVPLGGKCCVRGLVCITQTVEVA